MKSFLYGLILNIQFFTIIPLSKEVPVTDKTIKRAVETFPLIGFMQGIMYALGLYLVLEVVHLSPLASSFFLWLLLIIGTGAIHLDGWIDCSDAYFSFRDVQKRLTIMQDSRVGAFGVLNVIVLLAARFLFIYETVLAANLTTYVLILFIPFLGKLFMGMVMYNLPLAKNGGMAYFFKKAIINEKPWTYLSYLVLFGIVSYFIYPMVSMIYFLLVGLSALAFIISHKKIMKWFGGITGDVIGASVEGVETILWMIVWLLHYFVMG